MPAPIKKWLGEPLGEVIPDGRIITERRLVGIAGKKKEQTFHDLYRDGHARRTLKGIDEQVGKAKKVEAGVSVEKNRSVTLAGAEKSVNEVMKRREFVKC